MSIHKFVGSTVVTFDSFRFIYGNYNYTATYSSHGKGAFTPHRIGWTVLRREINKPNIPPYLEILTENLWEGVLKSTHAPTIVYPTAEEVVKRPWDLTGC